MGTKNHPGKFDCYASAGPDEPMFILLGRDPCAPVTVLFWSHLRHILVNQPMDNTKIAEAADTALAMSEWAVGMSEEKKRIVIEAAVVYADLWMNHNMQLERVAAMLEASPDLKQLSPHPPWTSAGKAAADLVRAMKKDIPT